MKADELVKRWELIEDQIRGLEYHLLSGPTDHIDLDYASRFAGVRSALSTLRVQYTDAKSQQIQESAQKESPQYEFGAPRFPYDEV